MNVFLTGATGFLGFALARALVAAGHPVVGLAGSKASRRRALDAGLRKVRVEIVTSPIERLDGIPRDTECLIHAAALRPPTAGQNSALLTRVNVDGTRRMVHLAGEVGCRRVLYISTQAVYGPEGAPWLEDAPLRPESAYAKSKLEGEAVVLRADGIDPKILRLSRLYGVSPIARWNELPGRFAQAVFRGEPLTIHGAGEQRFDLLHVRDAARCVAVLVTEWDRVEPAILNVGSGSSVSLNALVDLFEELVAPLGFPPVTVRRVPDHPQGGMRHLELDTSRIREHLGWSPTIGLREGLSEYLARLASAGSSCSTQ